MIFYGCLSPLSLPARRQSPLFRRLNIRDIDADRRIFTILKQKSSNPLGTLYLLHQAWSSDFTLTWFCYISLVKLQIALLVSNSSNFLYCIIHFQNSFWNSRIKLVEACWRQLGYTRPRLRSPRARLSFATQDLGATTRFQINDFIIIHRQFLCVISRVHKVRRMISREFCITSTQQQRVWLPAVNVIMISHSFCMQAISRQFIFSVPHNIQCAARPADRALCNLLIRHSQPKHAIGKAYYSECWGILTNIFLCSSNFLHSLKYAWPAETQCESQIGKIVLCNFTLSSKSMMKCCPLLSG